MRHEPVALMFKPSLSCVSSSVANMPLTSEISTHPSCSFGSMPCMRPPSPSLSSVTTPSSSLEMCVMMRVTGGSPFASRTVNSGPKSEKMQPARPAVMLAMKAMGAGFSTKPPRSSCTRRVRLRHTSFQRTMSLFLARVTTTASCASSSSSVTASAVASSTLLLSSCRRGHTTSEIFLPMSSSVRKKLAPRWRASTSSSSTRVTFCGPASARFFAASIPTPLTPTISTFIVTSLAIAAMPKVPI
mmetsp:Transcript_20120/g.47458  ORF Transcript_20120/g.47458 Transcript_20120/m.47458 type:complete len:244 (+) Transcript_20120:2639-3370(+)